MIENDALAIALGETDDVQHAIDSTGGRDGIPPATAAARYNRSPSVRRREPPLSDTVTLASIRAAAERLRGHIEETPCVHSRTLSQITGAEVYLKFENLQFTASFKERGALNKLSLLTPLQRQAGVIAVSAGNHAQGVAYHAQRLGIPAVIVMPRFTPMVKVERTRGFGAEIILTRRHLRRRPPGSVAARSAPRPDDGASV